MQLSNLDALVLAGGESKRMGLSKAFLPLGTSTVVGTLLDVLQPLFRQVLVVARERDSRWRSEVIVLTDGQVERGPLVGLARGLQFTDAPWCFVVGCDMPFVSAAVVERMAGQVEGYDVVVARLEGRQQPLHAFYSRRCLATARVLLDQGITSVQPLFDSLKVRGMDASEFRDVDPDLLSFRDVDTLEDYRSAQMLIMKQQHQEVAS